MKYFGCLGSFIKKAYDTLHPVTPCMHKLKAGIAYRCRVWNCMDTCWLYCFWTMQVFAPTNCYRRCRGCLCSVYQVLKIGFYKLLSIQTRSLKKYFQIYRQAVRKFALNFRLTYKGLNNRPLVQAAEYGSGTPKIN